MNTVTVTLAYLVALVLAVDSFQKPLRYQLAVTRLLYTSRHYRSTVVQVRRTRLLRRSALILAFSPLALASVVMSAEKAGHAWAWFLNMVQ